MEASDRFTDVSIQSLAESAGENGKIFSFSLEATYTDLEERR
jgi:hypothetical protein